MKIQIVLILIMCQFLNAGCRAQDQKSVIDLLTKYKWETVVNNNVPGSSVCEIYSRDSVFCHINNGARQFDVALPYYISQTPDTVFDRNKIGKNDDGIYIVTENMPTLKIIEITGKKMKVLTETYHVIL